MRDQIKLQTNQHKRLIQRNESMKAQIDSIRTLIQYERNNGYGTVSIDAIESIIGEREVMLI